MFTASYQKFYAVLVISLVLGFGAMSFTVGEITTTGMAVVESEQVAFPLAIFLFGVFVGMFAVGLLLTIISFEHKR